MGAECGRRWPILRPLFGIDPKQRGSRFCRDKEDGAKAAADILTKAAASKALTDRAVRLEDPMRPIRERLRQAGPIVELNVQDTALAKTPMHGSRAEESAMTTLDLDQEQFCICCNLWGPAETMPPLYRFRDQEAKPCLWLHHHCAEICSSMQFEAAMKRFESQVHSLAETQGRAAAMTRTDLTLPKQVRGYQAAAAVRCGRHHVRLPTLGISGSERAARFG